MGRDDILIKYLRKFALGLLLAIIIIFILITCIIQSAGKYEYEYTEAGYLVTKTVENKFYYIISDNKGIPIFEDDYYYTIFVDGNYIKVQVPYDVYIKYNLGDHLAVYRNYNKNRNIYKDYDVYIMDIHVPAIIEKSQ